MEHLISVIIPVYNTEKYLAECLDSVLAQTYKNLEIIIVDDRGSDNAIEIAESYAAKDKRIKIIRHEKNMGLSEARNSGIRAASGDWLGFVDSDDSIDKDFYEKLLAAAEKHGAGIAAAGTRFVEPDYYAPRITSVAVEYARGFRNIMRLMQNGSVWDKIFRSDMIKKAGLRFPSGLYFEDNAFLVAAIAAAPSMAFVCDVFYNYRQSFTSIVRNPAFEDKRIRDKIAVAKLIADSDEGRRGGIEIRQFLHRSFLKGRTYRAAFGFFQRTMDKIIRFCYNRRVGRRGFMRLRILSIPVWKKRVEIITSGQIPMPRRNPEITDKILNNPKISVLTPIYNTNPEHLREAIESILNQSLDDFEFIILNDSPNNRELGKIVAEYKDPRIIYAENEKNLGISESRNKLVDMARGEYLAVFDHDDISVPHRLWLESDFLDKHPHIGAVSGWMKQFGDIERIWDNLKAEYDADIKTALTEDGYFSHTAAMIRKSVLVGNGIRYEEYFSPAEDYRLWARMFPVTHFHNLQCILVKYRWNGANTSQTQKAEMKRAWKEIHLDLASRWPAYAREYESWLRRRRISFRLFGAVTIFNYDRNWIRLFGFIPLIKIKWRRRGV